MLVELSDTNDVETDEQLRESLVQSTQYLEKLREAFQASPSCVDFSCEYIRSAYMLAYYPFHIEPVYHDPGEVAQADNDYFPTGDSIRACVLGGGPGPEALGRVSYLQESQRQVKRACVSLLDRYAARSHKGIEITRYHLAPEYWDGDLVCVSLPFNFFQPKASGYMRVQKAFARSNLFIMQFCLNDLLGDRNKLMHCLQQLINDLPGNSLIVMLALGLENTRNFLLDLQREVLANGESEVLLPVKCAQTDLEPGIRHPQLLSEQFYENRDRMRERRKTKYYSLVFRKVVDPLPC